ncbi:hypothetical protein ACMATS_09065 [Streptoverticillium reticulum]|uniref:hypothetical protein n=1 Tax=Streptoverticillium reticulum TaxID=1433415 RepID=UPI0039BEE8F0
MGENAVHAVRRVLLAGTAASVLLAAVLAALGLWSAVPAAAATVPAAASGVPTCELGAYLNDLYNLDPVKHSFDARFTLWSVCPQKDLDPLPTVSFSNGNNPQKDDPRLSESRGMFRDLVRVQGTFRQDWDLRAFPFDRHRLEIVLTANSDIEHFRFTPDNANSAHNAAIAPDGWKLTGFRLAPAERNFPTNFGDPALPHGAGSTRSAVVIEADLVRQDPTVFWKLTGPLYLTLLLVTATFLLPAHHRELGVAERLDSLQSRLALLGGGLFVVMLNMQQAGTVVTSTRGLTLVDWLHLLTLAYVLLAVLATVLCWRWTVDGDDPAKVERLNRRAAVLGLVGYCAVAGVLVGLSVG